MKNPITLIALGFALGFGLAFFITDRFEIRDMNGAPGFYRLDTFTGEVWAGDVRHMAEIRERE